MSKRLAVLLEPFGPEEFAAASGVSRETLSRLKAYVGLLTDWNERHNLVSKGSVDDVWRRHIWDSAQLAPLVPGDAKTLVDLGSGAGFPGLVLALLLQGRVAVTLFEAISKKCEFLQAAAARMKVSVDIRNQRVEVVPPEAFDVITARACAPLDKLLAYAQHFVGPGTVCLFLKGQNLGVELTKTHKSWRMKTRQHPSVTHESGVVLEVRELAHVPDRTRR